MAYLRDFYTYGIVYRGDRDANESNHLIINSHADYAGNVDTRRSISGYLRMLIGGPVPWASHKQQFVSFSITEVEFVVMC
jgi:hypothetical protein